MAILSMDKFGYYQLDNYKTYSVYQLMDYYKFWKIKHRGKSNDFWDENKKPYRWIYNDDFYSQYDWGQEPTESLNELYKNRAKELREQYDYIVLYYSGGYDSANMLHAFLDNNIYPDEICTFYSKYDTVGYQYRELKNYTWQKLDNIKKKFPNIKIRKFDYSDIIFDWPNIIKRQKLKIDPIYLWGPRLSVHRVALDVMYEYIDDWKQLLKNNKSLCTLHGVDNPRLRYNFENETFVHNFSDVDVYGHLTTMRQLTDKKDRDSLEFFYWGPTEQGAKIIIKQCHLAKKFYSKLCEGKWLKLIDIKDVIRKDKNNPLTYLAFANNGYEPLKQLIYPRLFTDNEKFFNEHNISSFWGNRDTWYFNTDFPNSKKHWEEIYLSHFDSKHTHWKDFFINKTIDEGHRKILSKDYII